MDLSRTQLSGLLNNVTHEKTRFIQLLHKIKSVLSLNRDHKLILTSLDKLLLTSSPTLIYKNINFSHPVLKILIEIIEKTKKMGDGDKTFVEILKVLVDKITFLLENGIKAKTISDTFKDFQIKQGDFSHQETSQGFLTQNIRKYICDTLDDSFISNLLITAIENTNSFDIENIRISKVATGSTEDSYILDGILLSKTPEGIIKSLSNTSVGIFNCAFDINRTELKGTVLLNTAAELLNFSTDEISRAKELVDSLNVNVVIVCGNVNEIFLDFANSRNILVLRVFNKFDLKRLSVLLNAEILTALGPVIKPGFVNSVSVIDDGSSCFTKVIGCGSVNTIVLKNTMIQKCEELERKIINILETLKANSKAIEESKLLFSTPDFYKEASKKIGNSTVIDATVSEGLRSLEYKEMILNDQIKCLKYAFEFMATVLEIDDYLVARLDQLNVKPRNNSHWDDD